MKLAVTTVGLLGSLLASSAFAQTAPTSPRPAPAPATPGVNPDRGAAPGAGVVDRNTGPAAASGNRNQAVATTNANAPQPAKGANSFTDGEARRRIESRGYTEVSGLQKDADGIWHGTAKKDGNSVKVWLDYKGNVGAS